MPISEPTSTLNNDSEFEVDPSRVPAVTPTEIPTEVPFKSTSFVSSVELPTDAPSLEIGSNSAAVTYTMPAAVSLVTSSYIPVKVSSANNEELSDLSECAAQPAVKTNGDALPAASNIHEDDFEARRIEGTFLNDFETNVNIKGEPVASTSNLEKDLVVEESDLRDFIETEAWRAEQRHVFVLSSSGKPVYSRHGSEDKLVTMFGVMQALVSIVEDSDDKIESIHFGKNVIVFQVRGPIILVAVSKKNDSVLFCNNQLTYVYNQIVSVLTLKQVTSIFERRQNYDLRRLLTGSERLIDHLLQFYETEPSIFMNGISCIPMPSAHRESVSSAIISACSKIKNLVFAVLVANNKLISLARKRGYSMSPSDLHLILNMVAASESLKTAESWTPICLPNFNADGFLYAHVSYMSDNCPACLLLLTVDQELFFQLSEAKMKITEKLVKNKSMTLINEVLKAPPSLWMSLHALGLSKIRHFIYKCRKTSNVVSSPMSPPYSNPEEANALFTKYQTLYTNMIDSNPQIHGLFQVSAEETVICLLTEKFEILVAVEPMVKKQLALDLITKLCQWVQSEEDRFFLSNVPYL
uniref:Vacuolar fusion protein MON1 homolog n=1 Tax=Lygus hesperus TaxID=30085 RepID=A0A0A9YI31_LYGHE